MATLDQIIESVLERDGKSQSGQSLIVANHLTQMKMFGIRAGVELLPDQDDAYSTRKKFIEKLWETNKLELYLDRIWDLALCKGEVLLYLRPTRSGSYKIHFYPKEQFKAYYNPDGDLSEVIIRYSYKERTRFEGIPNTRWIKLTITSEQIEQRTSEQLPSFDEFDFSPNTKYWENTLKFIPCVVIKNYALGPGQEGTGEFEWLKDQIEEHDSMTGEMNVNLKFFGAPTLVSTRTSSELLEALGSDSENFLQRSRTLSSSGGWYSMHSPRAPDNDGPHGRLGDDRRIKRIIGNVQPDERFGYIAPDPISPDHNLHFKQNREEIHFALGSIDELGISHNATAFELKSIYGKVSTTALKKAKRIYDHGLCELFEMALAAEEDLFKNSIAIALKKDPAEMTDGFIQELMDEGKVPNGVYGLPPIGSRKVKWRWTGPVFEESPRDRQLKSIVVRNMQELGVRSLEALKFFFEDKTEKELEGMLEQGYPFRYFGAVSNSAGQLLALYQQLLSVPDPANPNQPLGLSIPLAPLIQRTIETLYNELNYGKQYDPVSPDDPPAYHTGISTADPYGAINAVPDAEWSGNGAAANVPSNGSGYPVPGSSFWASGINPYAFGASATPTGQSVAGGIQSGGGEPYAPIPDYAATIPTPGATIAQPSGNYQPPISQRLQLPGGAIPADLAVDAGAPGSIWQQLLQSTGSVPTTNRRRRKR